MQNGEGPWVLVVDDDAAYRILVGLSLRQAGFRVKTAPDGVSALELLKTIPFQWMITDGRMVPMDGLELSRQAKRICPEIRILMMSGFFTESDIRRFPIDSLFSKPVPMEKLLLALRCRSSP